MLDLISAYENYLTKVKQASSNTISSYMRDIRQYAEWLRINEGIDCGSVRLPLAPLVEADLAIAKECAEMIRAAVAKYC